MIGSCFILLESTSLQQLLYGIVLGIVQGISEWLPVSSKTQIMVVSQYLLKLSFTQAYAFGLFMEIGTIAAALIYFRKEVFSLINFVLGRGSKQDGMLFRYVLVSTVLTGMIGAPLFFIIDSIGSSYNIGIPAILMGILLICDAFLIKYARKREALSRGRKKLPQMHLMDYVIVGIAQGISALPGVSRSGATTSTLLLLGVDTSEAFRLSFIDMIFATSGAVALTLIVSRDSIASSIALIGLAGLAVSIIIATLVSLLLIDSLLKIAKKSSIVYFIAALGAIALGGGILALLLIA